MPSIFCFDPFYRLGQKSKNNVVCFLEEMRTCVPNICHFDASTGRRLESQVIMFCWLRFFRPKNLGQNKEINCSKRIMYSVTFLIWQNSQLKIGSYSISIPIFAVKNQQNMMTCDSRRGIKVADIWPADWLSAQKFDANFAGAKLKNFVAKRQLELQFSLKKPGWKVNFLKILITKSDFRCHQMKI